LYAKRLYQCDPSWEILKKAFDTIGYVTGG
jgi:hypothetical protein